MISMFEGLSEVNWEQVSGCYSSGAKVPTCVNALVNGNEQQYSEAIEFFWSECFHQGTRFEMSALVVPFLFEALHHTARDRKLSLINLILGIGVGHAEFFLPFGFDVETEEKNYQNGDRFANALYSFDCDRAAYWSVHNHAYSLLELLSTSYNSETRSLAATAIAHFAQPLCQHAESLIELAMSESDDSVLQIFLLAYGMLARFQGSVDLDRLTGFLEEGNLRTVRLCAAIASVTATDGKAVSEAIDVLLSAIANYWKLDFVRPVATHWNEGDLIGYAVQVCGMLDSSYKNRTVEAICHCLKTCDACTNVVPETLLDLLFPKRGNDAVWKVSEFNEVQLESLRILLNTSHWNVWTLSGRFVPAKLTGDDFRNATSEFLQSVVGDPNADSKTNLGNVSSWGFKQNWS